tara:strand:- start:394 stop:894 length:501 start_codon:yes stop_codon:yes gene_type:complete
VQRAAMARRSRGSVTPLPGRGTASANLPSASLQLVSAALRAIFWHMFLALGLLPAREAWAIVLFWGFCVAAAIVTIVQNVSPWAYAELMAKALWLLLVWRVMPLPHPERARHNVDEPRTEVENFRVVREGQVVGEARRTQHALIAQVELGGLGKFTFTLVPASRDG